MPYRLVLLAAAATGLALSAQAQPAEGLYISGGAGANWLIGSRGDAELPILRVLGGNGRENRSRLNWDLGWGGVGALGWGFGNGLRLEAEGSYRENEIDRVSIYGTRASAVNGQARSYGAMANVLYDVTVPNWPVTPYLGAGLGYVWHEYDSVRGRFGPLQGVVDDTDGRFAYQVIAGVSLPLGVTGLSLTAEYRFLGTLLPEFDASVRNAATSATVGRGALEVGNYNHSVMLGLRYAFNQPRPAVAATHPSIPSGRLILSDIYLVFFDFDRADLTDRTRQIIAEAAQVAISTGRTRIILAGHADRSGTSQYNQRLSQRRAEVVAAELVQRGISRDEISVHAFGESRPLVPTSDGMREPQNRRVEFVMR